MFRRVATWVLLVPLTFNGLWMVCADQEAPEPTNASAAATEATPHCATICPTEKQPETGAICFLSANADGTSIAVFTFAVAAPPPAATVVASLTIREGIAEQPTFYLNPTLSGLTPPPKA